MTASAAAPAIITVSARRRRLVAWAATLAATVVSAGALDATATLTGILLAASGLLAGLGTPALVALLLASYVAWGLGMRANVRANRHLLRETGTSTCAVSKAAHDLTLRRAGAGRVSLMAADAGYVAWNLVLEVPYWVAAFGAAAVSETVTSPAAFAFLAGANLGAGLYELGIARLTTAFLGRRHARAGRVVLRDDVAQEAVEVPHSTAPALVGAGTVVPLVGGGERRYADLDRAASTPCLTAVRDAVDALLPWYSSVHRGAGWKSRLCTDAYEGAREAVRDFVGGRDGDVVVFTRNTTDATNLLAAALPADAEVIAFAAEHHANLLPWRRRRHVLLPLPAGPEEALHLLEHALARPARGPRLVAVTGASNVTGEIWPYAAMARLAHRYGARIMLDAAQLAPHRRIDMAAAGIDYLALSGHKLYAPLGAGALVGDPAWLAAGEPFLAGGGAVRYVGTGSVLWAELPDRQEAGSPNVVGAVALGVACRTLQAADRAALERGEGELLEDLRTRMLAVPGVTVHRLWAADHPRIGVLPFSLAGVPYALLAAALSAEHGIGVRHGCFCAHPLMAGLLGIGDAAEAHLRDSLTRGLQVALPGAVRASLGLGSTREDCDRLVAAVAEIAAHGPRWTYASSPDGTDCRPDPDPRPLPRLPFDLAGPAPLPA